MPIRRSLLAALPMLFAFAGGCTGEDPEERVAAMTAEPASARFQSVRQRGDFVCGEVNGKDRQGGYGGYRRFVYDHQTEAGMIDPAVADVAAPAPTRDSACAKPFAYQTVEERLICAAAPEQQARSDRQHRFDELWATACSGREDR